MGLPLPWNALECRMWVARSLWPITNSESGGVSTTTPRLVGSLERLTEVRKAVSFSLSYKRTHIKISPERSSQGRTQEMPGPSTQVSSHSPKSLVNKIILLRHSTSPQDQLIPIDYWPRSTLVWAVLPAWGSTQEKGPQVGSQLSVSAEETGVYVLYYIGHSFWVFVTEILFDVTQVCAASSELKSISLS